MSKVNLPRKKIMRRFKINEISAVDIPAQEGALAALTKRADEAKLTDLMVKMYYEDVSTSDTNRAKPFTTLLEARLKEQKQSEAQNEIWPLISALDTSVRSIINDSSLEADAKQEMLGTTTEQFLSAIATKWPEVEETLDKCVRKLYIERNYDMAVNARKAKAAPAPVDPAAVDALAKQVGELGGKFDTLLKAVVKMTKAPVAKAEEEEVVEEEETAKEDEVVEEEVVEEESKSELTAEEQAFMDLLADEDKQTFVEATAKLKGLKVKTKKEEAPVKEEDDETMKFGTHTLRKSKVGADTFAVLKAQAEAMDTLAKQAKTDRELAKKERESRELMELTKRAESEFSHLPGEAVEKAKALKALAGLDDATRKSLEGMLKAGEAAINLSFNSIGVGAGSSPAAVEKAGVIQTFKSKVSEIAKRDNLSQVAAMTKARQEYPNEFAAYQSAN